VQTDTRDPADRARIRRRTVVGAVACAGLIGLNRLLVNAEHGPDAASGPASGRTPQAGPPVARPAGGSYRLRPSAGAPGAAVPGRRPVGVRRAAASTLTFPGRHIALTFDDGPHPAYTPQVLRVLRQYEVPATFFVIGENAAYYPDLVRDIAADGHVIANHSWSHPRLDQLPAARIHEELAGTCDVLAAVLGEPPRWARAPYGAWHRPSLKVCAELGMEPLGWSVDTEDWTRPGSAAIAGAVLDGAHPGGIVLAHDGGGDRSQTVAALAYYLPRLLDEGYVMTRPA
jgi:peptidoglycan/xylan/chitin deacetylase (PgdA/CDA1 family)